MKQKQHVKPVDLQQVASECLKMLAKYSLSTFSYSTQKINLPVAGLIYSWGDTMRVVGGETEAVVLLEALIGSHTWRKRG